MVDEGIIIRLSTMQDFRTTCLDVWSNAMDTKHRIIVNDTLSIILLAACETAECVLFDTQLHDQTKRRRNRWFSHNLKTNRLCLNNLKQQNGFWIWLLCQTLLLPSKASLDEETLIWAESPNTKQADPIIWTFTKYDTYHGQACSFRRLCYEYTWIGQAVVEIMMEWSMESGRTRMLSRGKACDGIVGFVFCVLLCYEVNAYNNDPSSDWWTAFVRDSYQLLSRCTVHKKSYGIRNGTAVLACIVRLLPTTPSQNR